MKTYDFDCGCKFPIIDENIKTIDGLPSIKIDYDNLNLRCPRAWELFTKGYTKGIFQLETNLGQSWAKKVQPVTIEEISALISILRPGCLKGLLEGKSIAQHYVDRKSGVEDFRTFHDLATPVLENTYDLMIYQEQTLSMAKIFAGFNLQQADTLRKGIGKKKADIVAKCRTQFIEGCEKQGIISVDDATALFDIIEKSNRYSFNKSHAVSYGVTGYMCAVVKAHFPLHFFTAWLNFASGKIKPREEIAELVQEAKNFDISIENPSIIYQNKDFIIDSNKVRYGIGSIKSVGLIEVENLLKNITETEKKLGKKLKDFTWHETLKYLLPDCRKDVVNNLIHAGALSNFGITRNKMLFEYNKLKELNDKEIEWLKENDTSSTLVDSMKILIENKKTVAKRKEKLQNILISLDNPSLNLADSTEIISRREEDVLGISLSCSRLDAKNTGFTNCTCKEFTSKQKTSNVIIPVQISRVTEWAPKDAKDRKLCFLTAFDKTGKIEIMVATQEYEKYSFLLFVGNTIAVSGSENAKSSLRAKVITQL